MCLRERDEAVDVCVLCVYVRVRACASVFVRDETLEYSRVQVHSPTNQQFTLYFIFPPLI